MKRPTSRSRTRPNQRAIDLPCAYGLPSARDEESARITSSISIDDLWRTIAELQDLCAAAMKQPDDHAVVVELLQHLRAVDAPLRSTGIDRRLDAALWRVAQSFQTWLPLIDRRQAATADWAGELKSGLFAVSAELERLRTQER